MTAAPAGPRIFERHSSVLGLPLLRYGCSCGHLTALHLALDCPAAEDRAELEMRGHLLDEHPEQPWPFGRCQTCGVPTDEFRAIVHAPGELGLDAWLCGRHAPSRAAIVDQVAAGVDGVDQVAELVDELEGGA